MSNWEYYRPSRQGACERHKQTQTSNPCISCHTLQDNMWVSEPASSKQLIPICSDCRHSRKIGIALVRSNEAEFNISRAKYIVQ